VRAACFVSVFVSVFVSTARLAVRRGGHRDERGGGGNARRGVTVARRAARRRERRKRRRRRRVIFPRRAAVDKRARRGTVRARVRSRDGRRGGRASRMPRRRLGPVQRRRGRGRRMRRRVRRAARDVRRRGRALGRYFLPGGLSSLLREEARARDEADIVARPARGRALFAREPRRALERLALARVARVSEVANVSDPLRETRVPRGEQATSRRFLDVRRGSALPVLPEARERPEVAPAVVIEEVVHEGVARLERVRRALGPPRVARRVRGRLLAEVRERGDRRAGRLRSRVHSGGRGTVGRRGLGGRHEPARPPRRRRLPTR
jgi:hypothetical protein